MDNLFVETFWSLPRVTLDRPSFGLLFAHPQKPTFEPFLVNLSVSGNGALRPGKRITKSRCHSLLIAWTEIVFRSACEMCANAVQWFAALF